MPNYHVLKDKSTGDWAVKKAGSSRMSGKFDNQKEAENAAKKFAAHAGGGEVRTHGLDGKIRDSDTIAPAKDSYPPRDRRH